MGVVFANINPDASLGFTRWALHMSAMLWRHFSSLSEFSFNLILLFFFPHRLSCKIQSECLQRGLDGFYWIKGPSHKKKKPHRDVLSALGKNGFVPDLVELHTNKKMSWPTFRKVSDDFTMVGHFLIF